VLLAIFLRKINVKDAAYLRLKVNVFGVDGASFMTALRRRIYPIVANAVIFRVTN